jgi:hypothetical protein
MNSHLAATLSHTFSLNEPPGSKKHSLPSYSRT